MASFDPNTPLVDMELDYISMTLNFLEFICLMQNLCMGTQLEDMLRQYSENANEMLNRWHSYQVPAKGRRLLIEALNKSCLGNLAEIVRMGGRRALQPSSAQHPSRPRKRTHTQNPAGHGTYMYTTGGLQPSSALYRSWSSKQQITLPLDPFNYWYHQPSASTYKPLANPPQQPDIVRIMRKPQQTSYEITEIKLRDVSNKLGAEWKMVGTYLGFSSSQIEVMQEENRFVKDCIFQMLLQWRNNHGVEATKTKLKKALRRSLRVDLVDFIDEVDD